MGPPRKTRAQRRAESRQDAKELRARERLATLERGGTPERPIEVVTAALVEPRARAIPCPICGESVRVDDHAARTIGGVALRLAHVACPMCGHSRIVYFVVRPPRPN
jgi:predicted RNA-binding Zn-ribbon protein involved in translation (DUF1610 family)